VHERERRARHVVRHAIATTDRPHQGRLAGAELTTESDEERRTYRAAKPLAPSGKLFLRDSKMTSRCQGRNRRRVACHLSEGALAAAARSTHGRLRPGRRLLDASLHRAGDSIGVEDRAAMDIARRPAHGLNQRSIAAQETLLVRIENGDEGDFREIETLA